MALLMSATMRAYLLLLVISLASCLSFLDDEHEPYEGGIVVPEATSSSVMKLDYDSQATALTAAQTLNDSLHDVDPSESVGVIVVEGDCRRANLTALEEMVKRCSEDLRDFHWHMDCPIPISLLITIDSLPLTRLYYEIPPHRSRNQDRQAILSSHSLYALESHVTYSGQSNFKDLRHIHDILASSPNLRELNLTLSHSGCVVSDNPWAFDFARDTRKLSALERLRLGGYKLDNSRNGKWQSHSETTAYDTDGYFLWPWKYLPRWAQDYWWSTIYDWGGINSTAHDLYIPESRIRNHGRRQQLEPHNLNAWLEIMDWSKLRVLALDTATPKILQRLSPVLHSLDDFFLGSGEEMVASELPAFLGNLTSPLRSLNLRNIRFDQFDELMEAIISSSNNTLEHLTLAEHEETRMHYCMSYWAEAHCAHKSFGTWYSTQPFLQLEHLEQIATQVRHLSHLELGIARFRNNANESAPSNETHWNIDVAALSAVGMIPSLTNLTAVIESPDHLVSRVDDMQVGYGWGHRAYKDPTFNRTSVPDIFQQLNEQRTNAGLKRLQELVIKVGQWDSLDSDWGMVGPPQLLAGRWVCQSDEDGASLCHGGNAFMDSGWGYARKLGLQDPYSLDWTVDDEAVQSYDHDHYAWDYDKEVVMPWE